MGATVQIEKSLEALIPKFLNYLKVEIEALKTASSTGDFATLKAKGHTLKGNCGGYGFDDLGLIAKELEAAALRNDKSGAEALVAKMADYIQSVQVVYIE